MRFKQIPVRALIRLAVALSTVAISLVSAPALASDAVEIPFNAAKILEYHNAERAARGLGGLSRDPRLDSYAQQLAESLAARGVLEHSQSVARSIGYAAGGQNLVHRVPSINASQANYMWMTSDNHRRNILNPGFTNVGIGLACSTASGRPYPVAVVDFGGTGLYPDIPPQNPIAVPADALQGRSLVCDGSAAPVPAVPVPPPAPAPAPVPAPVAAPVAPKPVAPKVVAPPPAPPTIVAPAPPPALEIAAALPSPEPPKPVEEEPALAQTADSTDRALAGWGAFAAGCIGVIMLAGVAGGLWYRLGPAKGRG